MRKIIAIIGDATIEAGGATHKAAFEIGRALVDAGFRVQTGGRTGVMSSALEGARASKKYREGDTIGITPFFDRANINPHADIVIATGLGFNRNNLVASADAVVAVGGGAGTLAEIAGAWHLLRLVIGYKGVDGWGAKLADQPVDHRVRYAEIPDDRVYGANSPKQVVDLINTLLPKYNASYEGIYARP